MVMKEESDLPIADELRRQSDRGAAILAAAYLEHQIDQALAAHFVTDAHTKDSFRKVFKHTGPAGAFGIKAEIAFLLGLCAYEMKNDLLLLSEIRNDFAHISRDVDFGSSEMRAKCAALMVPGGVTDGESIDGPDARRRFMATVAAAAACFH